MWNMILNIVLALVSVAIAFITYYLDIKKKIQESVNGEINKAEDTGEVGAVKMAYVVESIYNNIVPKVLRPILNKKAIEKIVQAAFDKLEEYAQKQAQKATK